MPETRILICGSRDWEDPRPIRAAVKFCAASIEGDLVAITGGAPGADRIAAAAARAQGMDSWVLEADWERDGKAAGPRRNAAMIALGPHVVLCFSTTHPVSPGSADTCRRATDARIPIFLRVRGRGWRYYPPRAT